MIHDLSVAQDPAELFDLVTAEGEQTGATKPRGEVHRDGDWHRAIHVWITGIDERGPFLTFQRRALAKDTWPGRLDATVGGHYRAGEGLEQTLREVDEEIGISVELPDLRFVGMRIAVNEAEPGINDHELQDVFFLRDDRPLTDFRPSPAELDALIRIPLADLLDFLAGERSSLVAESLAPGEHATSRITVTRSDFILRADRYFYRAAIAAARFLQGEKHISV